MTDLCNSCGRPRPRVPKVTPAVRAKVVHLRFRRKMKQTDIATAVGISQASVARILSENERNVLT